MDYSRMVRDLAKPGGQILSQLTNDDCHLWHMGTGCCTEAGELLDAIKKAVIYRRDLDRENVIEELGDLEFYMEGVRQAIGVSRESVLEANYEKLSKKRYKNGYSDKAAQERADKQ